MTPRRKFSVALLLLALITLWPASAKQNSAAQEAELERPLPERKAHRTLPTRRVL
jgi:hypothetical protein